MTESTFPPDLFMTAFCHIPGREFSILLLIPLGEKFEFIPLKAIVEQGLSHGIPALSDPSPDDSPCIAGRRLPRSRSVYGWAPLSCPWFHSHRQRNAPFRTVSPAMLSAYGTPPVLSFPRRQLSVLSIKVHLNARLGIAFLVVIMYNYGCEIVQTRCISRPFWQEH